MTFVAYEARALMALLAILAAPQAAESQARPAPDTYTATTSEMTPDGLGLKIDVVAWSDEAARAAVVSTLDGDADISAALAELPTVGYLWRSGSGVGYALKYAHRETTDDGGERITLVTDKRLGNYSFRPWAVAGAPAGEALDYSVIELRLDADGHGVGTLSLAADVIVDRDAQTVSLASDASTPMVLSAVTHEPKPYWAQEG